MNRFFGPSRKLAAHRLAHGGARIYDPRERLLLAGGDLLLRGASPLLGLRPPRRPPDLARVRSVLALRLDRLGDLLTTVPALALLRETDLICAVPRRFAAVYAARFGVMAIDPPLPLGQFRLNIVAPKVAMMDAGLAWLIGMLHATGSETKHSK